MPADESLSNPGIHYPPPLIFVAGIALGWLVDRLRPLPITDGPSLLRFALALVFGLAWWAGSVLLGALYDHDHLAAGVTSTAALVAGAAVVMWSGWRVKSA